MISSARNDVFGNSATVASTRLRRDAASFLLVEGSGATKTLTGIRIILAPWLRNEHAIFRCHCSAPPVGWGRASCVSALRTMRPPCRNQFAIPNRRCGESGLDFCPPSEIQARAQGKVCRFYSLEHRLNICASSKLHAVRTHLESIVFQRAELTLKIGVTMLHRRDFDGTEFVRTTPVSSAVWLR
jgi:hypothetical protein